MKTNKTNAARLLDRAKIPYELVPYEVDENNLAATHVAEQLGENIEQVFKTLVLRGDKHGIFVCVIPGDKEVDLKKAAKISGNKSAEMIAMKKNYPVYIHESCLSHDPIYISAGQRGLQIKIAAGALIEFVSAEVGDLVG